MRCKIKKSWVKAEMEHAHLFRKPIRLKMAKRIACDHVKELGSGYYPALFKMEAKLKRRRR